MGKKNKGDRRRQASADADASFYEIGRQLADPLKEYRNFLSELKESSSSLHAESVRIPLGLIDLTATLIASLLSGSDVTAQMAHTTNENQDVNFIRKLMQRAQLSCSAFLLGLYFASSCIGNQSKHHKRFHTRRAEGGSDSPRTHNKPTLETQGTIPTFLASVIVADKYLYDATYTNADWSMFTDGRYSLDEINSIEREFLKRLDWKLFTLETDYLDFLDNLDLMLMLRQTYRLGSLSYSDLYRLSSAVRPVFKNWQLGTGFSSGDAFLLFIKMVTNNLLCYLIAMATALAAASAVRYSVAMLAAQGAYAHSGSSADTAAVGAVVVFDTKVSYLHQPDSIILWGHELHHHQLIYHCNISFPILCS
ncbi:hypothetical protein SmJEL517_g03388 [Synchytrium microbalum]|uniref:Cyclin N-terminal domain-containing protein n=1 Tax=Synchytrium microbalum TaxID=1806994 RepID=A0A507BX56_9FUNG|nr:uncharacterized protein SmJEL517_g03388 [Synchytrium microbalum]TPX33910.1 hypothetical protein SmJEL517_g03388 [Synchytrium microbalum]